MRGRFRLSVASAAIVAASPAWAGPIAAEAPTSATAPAPPPPAPPRARLNTTGRDITLTVPLRARAPLGQVQITIAADDTLYVSLTDLANALARIVRPEELARLRALPAVNGRATVAAIAKLGYRLDYDSGNVELVVDFDPALLSTRTIQLVNGSSLTPVQPDRSSGVAAYLNYRVGETVQVSGPRRGEADFLGDFELAGRLGRSLSFDNYAVVDQRADQTFQRISSRLFYDLPGPSIRITAGDLITETAGFETDPQIAGLNVSHLISTFYLNAPISGVSNRNLVLDRDADVQILVNGIAVSQLHLGPGSYNLRNLPVAQGANNLQAVVTDSSGERRVENFSFFQSAQLLSPGVSEYTASAGVLAPLGVTGPDYSSALAFSGFYRQGVTDQLTLGTDAQIAGYDQVIGLDGVVGTSFGLFSLNVAGNHLRTRQFGGAARLQYSYADQTNSNYFARTFDVFVEYDSRYFQPVSGYGRRQFVTLPGAAGLEVPFPDIPFDLADIDTNDQALTVTGSVNQPISRHLNVQLNGTYTHGRDGLRDQGGLSALLTYQAPFATTLGLGVTYQWAPREEPQNLTYGRGISFLFTLTHRFSPRAIVNASVDRFDQRASFTLAPSRAVDDVFANADASHNRFGTTGDATVGYETNRGNLEATYSTALGSSGDVLGQQIGGYLDGSVVFAGGMFGLGRRITDSFAVIGKDPSLGDRQVIVQTRFANDVVARSGTLGPAVVPISSYQRSVIPYDVADLPPGYDLGTGNFELYPWYRSGFRLKVGSPYNVTITGSLVDAGGAPVALRTGEAVSLTDPKAPKVEVITNDAGRFAASGLAPGRYRISMSDDGSLVYTVTVAQSADMLARMGVVRPDAK